MSIQIILIIILAYIVIIGTVNDKVQVIITTSRKFKIRHTNDIGV